MRPFEIESASSQSCLGSHQNQPLSTNRRARSPADKAAVSLNHPKHGLAAAAIVFPSEAVCQIHVGLNKNGMLLLGGMNPIAVAEEAGFDAERASNAGTIDFSELTPFYQL